MKELGIEVVKCLRKVILSILNFILSLSKK
jgi:hypothetical protein